MREEELKNRVAADWFGAFDCSRIIGNIDFCVDIPATELDLGYDAEPALWAEAKAGARRDIVASFVQLILTIGGQHTADKNLPPHFLGAFDAEKIAFLPYNAVLGVLGKNDFDWTVAPSDHESKEFKELYALAKGVIDREKLLFRYAEDGEALHRFIRSNFKLGRRDVSKILINKNNFTHIYRQWREAVMPFIAAPWDVLKKKYGIYDRDFYLAEMNIDDNGTPDIDDDSVANDFYITFEAKSATPYTVKRKNEDDLFASLSFGFKPDGLDAYAAFWRRYKRPPKKEYWNFIVNRLDLLVPQDVRERKGSFFTPAIWVEKSQQYIADVLGENWQDEYFVWDCCAGTGNLLAGLTNKYNIWASTLDEQDVEVMRERIKGGANLLDSHVFRFDFLNDSFDKLPQGLRDIISDSEKRKKLVVYINPPYAEAGDAKQLSGTGQNKTSVSVSHATYERYVGKIGLAGRELFALFLMRIVDELQGCLVGQFSKLKHLQAPNFAAFRKAFRGNLEKCFLAPADTFDNVKGKFPIGFFVWRLAMPAAPKHGGNGAAEARSGDVSKVLPKPPKELRVPVPQTTPCFGAAGMFTSIVADVYDRNGCLCGEKTIIAYDDVANIGKWVNSYRHDDGLHLGFMSNGRNDFQNQKLVYFINDRKQLSTPRGWWITPSNLIPMCIFVAVRHSIEATWLNDRDQYLFPNDEWNDDRLFQFDCLVYALFSDFNAIKSSVGVNHWIPFTEAEVDAKDRFESHFMSDYLKSCSCVNAELPNSETPHTSPNSQFRIPAIPQLHNCTIAHFSPAAKSVLDAGRELWRYYHAQPGANPNASYYDIRLHFQGSTVDAKGKAKMNPSSADETYTSLLASLRAAMKRLAKQIEPKVYEYGFLKR